MSYRSSLLCGDACGRELSQARRAADDARYELERVQDELAREREREQRAEERRRRERLRENEKAKREAEDWTEAFAKQRALLNEQIELERRSRIEDAGQWLVKYLNICNRAESIWREASREIAPLIEAKRRDIAELEVGLRERAAVRVTEEFPDSELPEYLRDNDPSGWLHW